MVRAVSCHHFVSQDVFLSDEPVAFCGSKERLLVATNFAVNVHDLDNRGNVLHSFSTIDIVKQIIYCESGNYVATIENKTSRHVNPVSYVRVYFKWWMSASDQPLKVRVAGCAVTPDSFSNRSSEMVELPLDLPALCIACCDRTSTLAVSLGTSISVYCHSNKICGLSKQVYNDFEHFADITVPIVVQELDICENYFACMSDRAVHVFKVSSSSFESDESEVASVPVKTDSEELDENFIEWRFESCTSMGLADTEWDDHLKSKLHESSFPINIRFHAIDKANETFTSNEACEYLGPLLTVRGCPVDVRLNPRSFEMFPSLTSNIFTVTFLFRQFVLQGDNSKLSGLQLVPYFKSDPSPEGADDPLNVAASQLEKCTFSLPWFNVTPSSSSSLQGIGCFFSTPRDGYLYDITNRIQFVGACTYTSTLKGVVLDTHLLHALTDTGLETYTVHLPHSFFPQLETVDDVRNIVPKYDDPVCLLGLRPFLGVDHLVKSENHLILISSVEDSVSNTEPDGGNKSTLYSLKEPESSQVFADLLEVAETQKSSSPSTYCHLLSEAHMILRTQNYFGKPNTEIATAYKKSCLMLADYYLCHDDVNKAFSVPYYHLSMLSAENVIKRMLDFREQLKLPNVSQPLVVYVESIIFEEKLSAASLCLSQSTADSILSAYSEECPERLWKIILCSNFEGYKLDKAILALKRRLTNKRQPLSPISNAADTTALVYLLLLKGSPEVAQSMIMSLAKSDLLTIMSSISSKIWDAAILTTFGKFLKQSRPDAFVELLVSYLDVKKFQIPEILQILQAEAPDAELHCVPLVKEFLETILRDKSTSDEVCSSVLNLLVKIYLKKLLTPRSVCSSPSSSSSITFSNSMSSFTLFFVARATWLNDMPPFNGKGVSKTCLLSPKSETNKDGDRSPSSCCCWNCNEDLLRLQSLLSYLGPPEEIKTLVLEFLCSAKDQIPNWLSVEVMCSDEVRAIKLLIGMAPRALLPYATANFKDDKEKWSMLFKMLHDHMLNIPDDHPEVEIYTTAFDAVLSQVAELLDPLELLSLLPRGENHTFLPHVMRTVERHQADQLKVKIVSLGQEIKSMMLS